MIGEIIMMFDCPVYVQLSTPNSLRRMPKCAKFFTTQSERSTFLA
jgi:hypothetical protein